MKIVLETLGNGKIETPDVPQPEVKPGTVLVRNERSVISSGTDRMLLNFGRSSLVGKTRQQPEKVKQVIQKARTDGVASTFAAVSHKLDQPMALGYSCAGIVTEVGKGISDLQVGDLVAGNGSHAQVVRISRNLCAKVPAGLSAEEAAFAPIGAISLQGIRLLEPTIGECIAVTGLGLIGLICVQLLRANGCRVLAVDYDAGKLDLARQFGAEVVNLANGEDLNSAARSFSRGRGVDGVLVCAASQNSDAMNHAAEMCRVRGRVIQVGVTGLDLVREAFFRKEIVVQVSNSTGPGRGDPAYEVLGQDYPVGFVRWTQQRNFEAVLDMISQKRLDIRPLITHRFGIEDAESAYEVVGSKTESSLAIVLTYPETEGANPVPQRTINVKSLPTKRVTRTAAPLKVGFIGSGNYASAVLIPAFAASGVKLKSVASSAGVSGLYVARKFGFEETTTDVSTVLTNPEVDAVAITTRHDTHANFAIKALNAGKSVFVEKPLALTFEELDAIEQAYGSAAPGTVLMVGFNRRFSPLVRKAAELLNAVREPKVFVMTVNAGALPPEHWAHDLAIGGGRMLGEGCHFIDLLRFFAKSPIAGFHSTALRSGGKALEDHATVTLTFEDGSVGTIHYLANGHKAFPKERLEIFVGGRILQLDNFRKLSGFGWPKFKTMKLWRQDKGQVQCAQAFVEAVALNRDDPIPVSELFEVSRVTIQIAESLR